MLLKVDSGNIPAENARHFRTPAAWLALMLCVFTSLRCAGQEAKPDIAPPASWIVPIPFNPRAKLAEVDPSQDMRWILTDRQINAQSNEAFNHQVRQVLTPSGVNNASHISIVYDPSYQLLTFHWVRIWRGTNSLNRLDPAKIQVSQQGLDTENLFFSDEKTALLLLLDVRVGDIIDYAYSVQGGNPVFAGRFTGRVEVQSTVPVDRLSTRLLWPPNRRLYVQNHGTQIRYSAVRKGALTEYIWNVRNVAAFREEPPLPVWYQPLPWVQLSEFQRWSDVSRLALDLFTNAAPFSPDLRQKISEWKRLPDPETRVLAALRFVQDDVRYLGVETGSSGYRPATPAAVFDRRFGDCKDKTLLLVTALRALGVEAYPALVNTKLRQTVQALHPSATVFDHALTLVNLNGQSFWLDATANYQRGPLAVRSWPAYGYALVVRPSTTALTAIAPSPVSPRTTAIQYVRLGQLDQDSEFKVVTITEGADAEQTRAQFATTAREEIQRQNLNYYAKFYPEISQTSPLIYADDEQQNRIEVDEFYTVRKIWSHLSDEAFFHCRIYPQIIEAAMKPPSVSVRTMPLGVAYPRHQTFRAEIVVPALVYIQPADQTIENPAFYFHRMVSIVAGKLVLDYDYRSLSDAVQPDAVSTYVQQLDAATDVTGYTVTSPLP